MVGEIEEILRALNHARVRYLVVGGVAGVLHGYPRTTANLDLILHLERENVLEAMRALRDLAYRPRAPVPAEAFAEQAMREEWLREEGLSLFSLWSPKHPILEIALFVAEPFDFDAVYSRAVRVPLRKTEATVIGLEDLIALKKSIGRPGDPEDVAALESLRQAQGQAEADDDAGAEPGGGLKAEGGFNLGFDAHSRRQARLGLQLTPAERLQWLEKSMEQLRALVGRARLGRPVTKPAG